MRFLVRKLTKDDAICFIQNMRWFAGFGKITVKKLGSNLYSVRASRGAWSHWAG